MTSKKSILLIGLGRFGRHIAMKLDELHHQVMAVDKEDSRVEAILPFVTNALIGDATNEHFLSSLGIRNFDVCIVAIGDNFQNSLETTSLLKELGAKMVVSRASRDIHAKFLLRNGADEIVYPEKQLANWTAIRYSSDHILDYIELDEDHAIFELPVPHEWTGKTVGQLDIRKRYDINIMAVKTNGILNLKVNSDTYLSTDSSMLVLGEIKYIQKYFHV
jgi:trk system potassium uptake protein TrkA